MAAEFTIPQEYKTDKRTPVRWIGSHAIRQWPLAVLAIIAAVLNAGLASISALYIGDAFNAILAIPADLAVLKKIAILIAITQIGRSVIQLGRNFSFELIAQRVEKAIRDELYTSLLGKSMTFHNLQSVGETMSRATNDVREINFLFSPGINLVIGSVNFLIMPIIVAPTIHPALILTPVFFMIFYFIALADYLKRLQPVTDEVRASFGNLNGRLAEALDGIEVVKGACQEEAEISHFENNANRYCRASIEQAKIEAKFIPLLLFSVATALGFAHALYLSSIGQINLGQAVSYLGLLLMLDFPTFISIFAYSQISLGISSARRILELILQENNLDQNETGFAEKVIGEVEFQNVTFSYPDGECGLENISFKVKAGQTVAIVGQTGAGKTTLVKLINRIFDVSQGKVLVDGVDVKNWNLATLRQNISIIEQDIFLFSKTVKENISFGKPMAESEEVIKAAHFAQANDFILSFSEGYDTQLGERGVNLSGGQRQRLALARAFLTDPPILILDDSTSAIDSATEDKIQKAIFTAAKGRTTFIITHRLSQIRWADLILVLRKGKLVAAGDHETLLTNSEAYRRIFSM